ncbi:MAG: LptF/LptG family permease [Candidatus Omnitrophica bacterium]|nr:LptF/LptG family permease [Candidatus Omnitrophota bacterium]
MRILDKYITKSFLPPFFYCLFLFIFLYIIIDLFGHLDEILKYSVPILILQEYYLSILPFILIHTIPVAALISTIYGISTMNKHDEILAMRAAGINIFRILSPYIYIGLLLSLIVFVISEKLVPISMKNALSIKKNYIEKEGQNTNKREINNIALYGKDDRLIFIKSYDIHDNIAKGITILHQDKNSNVVEKMNAQEGEWIEAKWEFLNILIYKLDEKGMVEGDPLFFKKKSIKMEGPKELLSKGTNYEFMNVKDISNYIDNFSNASPDIIDKLQVNMHQKISFPFTSLILILIGAGSSIKIKRGGKIAAIMGMGMSITIAFIYYALMATCIALGKGGILIPSLSAHLANIVFGLVGIMLIRN